MKPADFTNLTGQSLSTTQAARFVSVSDMVEEAMVEVLGWPLDPDDFDDQYDELGKLKAGVSRYTGDPDELDAPDDVEGSTRVYRWSPLEPYIFIDPATDIHAVKIVRGDITYRTLDPSEYRLVPKNSINGPWGKYLKLSDNCHRWWLGAWPLPSLVVDEDLDSQDRVTVAVDADWAFDELPKPLLKVQADMIAYELDTKRDVKSESMLGHSYSRNTRPVPTDQHASVLATYAGPNGQIRPDLWVA